jgi:hypothetical protein
MPRGGYRENGNADGNFVCCSCLEALFGAPCFRPATMLQAVI